MEGRERSGTRPPPRSLTSPSKALPFVPLDTVCTVCRAAPRPLQFALRAPYDRAQCISSCAQAIAITMPRGQNSQVILRQRHLAAPTMRGVSHT